MAAPRPSGRRLIACAAAGVVLLATAPVAPAAPGACAGAAPRPATGCAPLAAAPAAPAPGGSRAAAASVAWPAAAQPRRPLSVGAPHGYLLTVERRAAPMMRAAGARALLPAAGLWHVATRSGAALRARLLARGLLVDAADNPPRPRRADQDPLAPRQFMLAAVGADTAPTPPPPRRRLLVIDSGLALEHPEFLGRPRTVLENRQGVDRADPEEWHGTAVASVAAAARNGEGMEGVYPAVPIGAWDAGELTSADVIAGLAAAVQRGYAVVNLSLGGLRPNLAELLAVSYAYGRGVLAVVATGNENRRSDAGPNPDEYPAAFPHVLTVAATDERDAPAGFSNRKRYNDVSAPGVGVLAAVPIGFDPVADGLLREGSCSPEVPQEAGWCTVSGTSFASPIVAGAAAWVWSARPRLDITQLAELLRRSARDVGPPGFDRATGWGVVSIPRALARAAPPGDPAEPNEDVTMVDGRLFRAPDRFLLAPGARVGRIEANVDPAEDPVDVYRIALARGARARVTVKPRRDALLVTAYGGGARSVGFVGPATRGSALGGRTGTRRRPGQLAVTGRGRTGIVYLAVRAARGGTGGPYRLVVERLRR